MTTSNNIITWSLKFLRLKYRISKIWTRVIGTEKKVYVDGRISFYKEMWKNAALELSAQFFELAEGIWEIRYGKRLTRVNIYKVQLDDPVVLSIAGNKALCYGLMKKNGLSVPKHVIFRLDETGKARRFMKENEGLFVIKPALGTSAGIGVSTHIESYRECRQAAALASLYSDQIIIERLIPGESYRLLFLNGEMICASRRRGLRVKGDGKSAIWQLLERKNKSHAKTKGYDPLKAISPDRDWSFTLKAQGLTGAYVLEPGREVLIKSSSSPFNENVEVVPVYNENVTNLVCKDIIEEVALAVRILNSKFAGVDIITLDPTVPLKDSGGAIIEINTTPGLHHHYNLVNNEDTIPPAVNVLQDLLQINSEA